MSLDLPTKLSALTLLVLGIFADDHYFTVSLNDLALIANLFDGRLNFHFL